MELATFETWVKIIGAVFAAAGVSVASYKAIWEWRRSTAQRQEELEQRRREFRHKQAIFARELIREIFSDARARDALKMLDYARADYQDERGLSHGIEWGELKTALTRIECSEPKELIIRTRFESLYHYFEQLEHLISLDVINYEDVEGTFRYYIVRALDSKVRHFEFLDGFDYPKAKAFLLRFEGRKGPTFSEPGKFANTPSS